MPQCAKVRIRPKQQMIAPKGRSRDTRTVAFVGNFSAYSRLGHVQDKNRNICSL
jgi:hypothetical protein